MTLLDNMKEEDARTMQIVREYLAFIEPHARHPDIVLFEFFCYVKVQMALMECIRERREFSFSRQ